MIWGGANHNKRAHTAAALSVSLTNPLRIAMFSFGFQVNKEKGEWKWSTSWCYGAITIIKLNISNIVYHHSTNCPEYISVSI